MSEKAEADTAPARPSRRRSGGRPRTPVPRELVARVIAKADQIRALSPAERDGLLDVLGEQRGADDIALVCLVLGGPRDAASTIATIRELRALDPTERGVRATMLALDSKDRLRACWRLIRAKTGLPRDVLPNPAKAGLDFALAVERLTDDDVAELAAPLALLD